MIPRPLAALVLLAILAGPAAAQERGSITGKVSDKKTGHAIPFANIALPGVKLGGLTDSEGQYKITGVPVGTHELRVQFLGYKPESRTDVVVTAGRATVVNFQLVDIVVREEKVVEVTGERRLVEVKQGATIRSVTASEIRNLPVQTIDEVLQQQAGVNVEDDQIHVRGGRADETMFIVNGVANRDLVTGASTAGKLNARSVAEVNVATGAYDVRYGNALSGVIDVKLKEGGDRLSGGLTLTSGSYGGRSMQFVVGGPDPIVPALYQVFALGNKAPGTMSSILDVSASLFETRFRTLYGSPYGVLDWAFEPSPHATLKSSYEDAFMGETFRYGGFFGPSQDNDWALRYGLTWKIDGRNKLLFNASKRLAVDQGFSRTFINAGGDLGDPAYPWRWAHRIEHAPTIFEDNVQTSLDWRRTLSATSFFQAQISRYFYARRQDVQGKDWSQYEAPDDQSFFPPGDPRRSDYFIDTGDDETWQDSRTTSWGLQASLVRRLFHRHEFEFGIDQEFQTVQYVTIEQPWIFDEDGLGSSHDLWQVHPWVGDLYIRDRLEYEGFVGNLGIRADYWFMSREAEQAIADTSNHNITSTTRTNFYEETHSFFGRRYKMHLSPRVIVAHPITENSSFFFNYGQFTQNPSYRYVYSKLTSVSSEAFPLLGNPNLNPQVSINYEVGAKHQFLPTAAANLTFFVKDIYDYPVSTTFRRSQGAELVDFFVYLNGHFARSKGFEIELQKRRNRFWSGRIVYTFQQTKGKSSNPFEQKVVQESGGDPAETRISDSFVRWNRPHKLAVNLDLRFDEETPVGWEIVRHSGFNFYLQGQSGRAYTPSVLEGSELKQSGETYSQNGIFQLLLDVKVNHYFRTAGRRLDLSLQGTNVFGNLAIGRVDRTTGRGRLWGVGEYDPSLPDNNDYTRTSEVDDPSNYGPGAQWRLVLDYDF